MTLQPPQAPPPFRPEDPRRPDDQLRPEEQLPRSHSDKTSDKASDRPSDRPSDAKPGRFSAPVVYATEAEKSPSPLKQWFYNLPIRRKQLLGLLTSEAISVLGLVGGGALLLLAGARSQLAQQARSELAMTETIYNIKINQMALGFRADAENPTVIQAAKTAAEKQSLSAAQKAQLKSLLAGEIKAREIEFATLVGTDLRIIGGANSDRSNEPFDPSGVVTTALANLQQVRTNALISSQDLSKEGAPLPRGLTNQDALIRYVATPVKNPQTGVVIGVLVAGDIVNRKTAIPEEVVRTLNGGYSGVYLYRPSGELQLSTALEQSAAPKAQILNQEVGDRTLLQSAIEAKGEPITGRMKQGNQAGDYTVAAKALTDLKGNPVAVLVRGASEDLMGTTLKHSLLLQLGIATLAVTLNILLARLLGRAISQPIEQLKEVAQRFGSGDRQARATVMSGDEVGELTTTFNRLADSVARSEQLSQLESNNKDLQNEKAILLNTLTTRMRQSLDPEEIFPIAVNGVRESLVTDRVIVYLFDDMWQGTIVAESVGDGWVSTLGEQILDPCFAEGYIEKYRRGRVQPTDDIHNANLTDCHIRQLERFGVKANLVAPIIQEGVLLGLLIAHHCKAARQWLPPEIEFLRQSGMQMGYALEQAKAFAQRDRARLEAQAMSDEQRQQKESLQHQLLSLLSEVEGASRGNLMVRAEVTAGEIGTVADFFNSIVESLRQLVLQVKRSVGQVNNSIGENEVAVRQLADEALTQAEEITRTLDSMEQMTGSMQTVATQAQQAADVAKQASTTAEAGGVAMDLTVQNILNLRETVGETAKKVKRLGESSQQISRVVALINQIAMQTNLLAINAGIEASRAGEEAQGFGVVAEEVGDLAARAAAATQEIERIVETIQRETNQVVTAMEQSTAQVVEGTHRVEDAKQSLTQIVEVSRQIDQLVQSISTATVSQVETSAAVSDLMRQVATTSESTSAASRQVSEAMRQTVAIAQDLQTSVETFEVGKE
jgi:twitching motility protein PilJ